ncbi:uracil-DNA glycosylase family protein [Methanoculleus sp.]|uniref:uracil-DNA glycosylase family protein n=1 Tax=Methanoculleus sp. TaxID=90427 RepID=UPI002FCB85DE
MDPLPVSTAEVYRTYAAGRPDLRGVLLPDLLPHDACGAAERRPGRVKVLFVAESPPWAAGRHDVAGPPDCLRPDYPYFWNDRYDRAAYRRGTSPLSLGLAENLFFLLGLDGPSRRENLDLFAGQGLFLVDTVKCVFRKNRKASIPNDLVRLSAREVLAPEIAALGPEYVVSLGNTALSGLREIEPYATALCGAQTVTTIPGEALFEENRLLCLPYPGWRNRRYLDRIESGFRSIRDLVS